MTTDRSSAAAPDVTALPGYIRVGSHWEHYSWTKRANLWAEIERLRQERDEAREERDEAWRLEGEAWEERERGSSAP